MEYVCNDCGSSDIESLEVNQLENDVWCNGCQQFTEMIRKDKYLEDINNNINGIPK